MTIEERAKAKYPTAYDIDTPSEVRAEKDAYIAGATEQREIDIQRAVEILKATGYFQDEEFREEVMIDQFEKAMKGEEK